MANNTNFRFSAETLDNKFKEKTFKDIFTAEEHDKMRAEYCKKFDELWNKGVNVASIATIKGVSTSAVISYVSNDVKRIRLENLHETINAIGAGKPKMSEEEKAFANLARTLGLTIEEVKAKFNK